MQYQWIIFDADETLFYFDSFAGLKLMFSRFDIEFTHADFEEYQRVNKPGQPHERFLNSCCRLSCLIFIQPI